MRPPIIFLIAALLSIETVLAIRSQGVKSLSMEIPPIDFSKGGGSPEGRPRNEYFDAKLDYTGANMSLVNLEEF